MTGYLDRAALEVLLAEEDDGGGAVVTDPKALARLQTFMASVGVPADATEIRITLGASPRVLWQPAGAGGPSVSEMAS
jgi:hypothetical protein